MHSSSSTVDPPTMVGISQQERCQAEMLSTTWLYSDTIVDPIEVGQAGKGQEGTPFPAWHIYHHITCDLAFTAWLMPEHIL